MSITKSEGMNQINNLMNIIENRDKQIKELKSNSKNNNVTDMSNIKIIIIGSCDSRVLFPMACRGNQTFSEIEAKLYEKFPDYKETNNYFICKGNLIMRFKTIDENKIEDGDRIILCIEGE